jgi:hypothetical protein
MTPQIFSRSQSPAWECIVFNYNYFRSFFAVAKKRTKKGNPNKYLHYTKTHLLNFKNSKIKDFFKQFKI